MKAIELQVGDKVFMCGYPKQYGIVKRVEGEWVTVYVYNRYGNTKLIQAVGTFTRGQLRKAPLSEGPTLRSAVLAHYDRMIAWAEKQTEQITLIRLREGAGESIGPGDCPLCQRYGASSGFVATPLCVKCPVYKRTTRSACADTPWETLWRYVAGERPNTIIIEAFKAEREFLAGLDYTGVKE